MNATVAESVMSEFIRAARSVCREIEQFDGKYPITFLGALTSLLDAAEALAGCKLEADDSDLCIEKVEASNLELNLPDIVFHEVFDPLDPNSVTAVSLRDCLSDMYCTLKGGLQVLDQTMEKQPSVLWEWRNEYQFHWRRHLIDTIRFLILSKIPEVQADSQ